MFKLQHVHLFLFTGPIYNTRNNRRSEEYINDFKDKENVMTMTSDYGSCLTLNDESVYTSISCISNLPRIDESYDDYKSCDYEQKVYCIYFETFDFT